MYQGSASLCFSCNNSRADRCQWIQQLAQVWSKADIRPIKIGSDYVDCARVRVCDHFQPLDSKDFSRPSELKEYPLLSQTSAL